MWDAVDPKSAERETQWSQANREELADRVGWTIREDGVVEALKGLHLHRCSSPTEGAHGLYDPALCVIVQGSKEVLLGDRRYRYDPAHYLLATAEILVESWVIKASRKTPYLSLHLRLETAQVVSALAEAGPPSPQAHADARALDTGPLDVGLLDALVRLVRLIDAPAEARVLAPLVTREIVHRLVMGQQGGRLRYMAGQAGIGHGIAHAVERIRKGLDRPLRIEDLARDLGMSVSGFHSHFKAYIGLSPLQFQKRIRLQEARRLMLDEALDAASAGYRVGYDDAAHFSRQYKGFFGVPPRSDVERLREAARTAPD